MQLNSYNSFHDSLSPLLFTNYYAQNGRARSKAEDTPLDLLYGGVHCVSVDPLWCIVIAPARLHMGLLLSITDCRPGFELASGNGERDTFRLAFPKTRTWSLNVGC